MNSKNNHKIIGNPEQRVDAIGKVTGTAKFAEDYNVLHQLYGKVLRSKYPHAKILSVDTSKAEQLDGVEAVLTANDIPGKKVFGIVVQNQTFLAIDKVRYLGDGVALVAAKTKEIAEQAIALIDVQYEPLPVIADPEESIKTDAVKIHGDDNTFVHHKVRKGDIEKGFAEADFILEKKFKTQFIEHSYIEPEAVLAELAEHGGVKITGSVQNLFSSRRSVAAALNLDLNKVQIIQSTLGGSFGGKDEVMTSMCCRAALLCLKTGKPVKMVNTREESMLESYKRHPYVLFYKWGVKNDGSITAMEIKCIADGGAYASMSPFVTWRSVVQATGPYHCENVKTDIYAVYTNNNYTGAMRGFGSPQVNFAIESMMDELAEKVGKNPIEIRLQNGYERGDVTATGQKLDHNVSYKEVLKKAAEAINFEEKWKQYRASPKTPFKKGIGLASSYRGVSLGAEGTDAVGTIVSVQTDGSVIVSSGITDMGQGAQTQMSQITAEVLGISMERIQFLNTNTSRVPDSGPTVASRGTIMSGSAAKKAAEIVKSTLLDVASEMTGVALQNLDIKNNYLVDVSNDQRLASFSELAAECFNNGKPMYGLGWHKSPHTSWDEEHGQGDAYYTFVYGTNIAEIEVDTETGKVNVVDFVSAHDVGKAINRNTVLGQIYGGVAMGLGYGMLEEFEFENGIPKQLNFDEYLIATAMDVPRIKAIIVENEDAAGPFGAKSIGEPATELAAPAIVNAIYNATGKRIYEIPANLERVLLGHKLTRTGERGSVQKEKEETVNFDSCKIRSTEK
ncbi:MAG: xanthine dehydrogenase family protein molybdopterin-binding subunit [Bacteroidota bacterium]|nr:xanthine dehydrogenase family protein molybdopterin-binding subunit [Bacteroidota bacterium]